jgi:hypothetical protein
MASIITSLFRASNLLGTAESLFFGNNKKTKIGDLVLDAALTEVITLSSTITEHPIETKEAISDHIFKNPLKVKIEGYITDSPIKIFGILETPLQNNSVDKIINSINSFLPFQKSAKPSVQAYQLLTSLYENRALLNVVTKLNAFRDMAIESISFNNDVNTGQRLEFSAELVQVRFATVRKSFYTSYKDANVSAIASPMQDKGISEKGTSAAAGLFDGAAKVVNKGVNFITS